MKTRQYNNRAYLATRTPAQIAFDQAQEHPTGRKHCRHCHVTYPLSHFRVDSQARDGLWTNCLTCKPEANS